MKKVLEKHLHIVDYVLIICVIVLVSVFSAKAVTPEASLFGDINGDGKVNIRDVTTLQMWLVGQDVDAPVGEPVGNEDNVSIDAYELAEKAIEFNFIPILESEEVSEGEEYVIIDASELSKQTLNRRADEELLVVERVVSRINKDGKGEVVNTGGVGKDTLNFRHSGLPITEGDLMLTYRIYNPMTNDVNDVVNRYDYILDRR